MIRAILLTIGIASLLSQSASAQNLNARVKALEKKTNDYSTVRTKSWPPRTIFKNGGNGWFVQNIRIRGDAVITNAWLHVTGTYKTTASTVNFRLFSLALQPERDVGPAGTGNGLCGFEKDLPGGSGTIDIKVFCRGVINPQYGELHRANISIYARTETVTLHSLAIRTHLVNQVVTEPPVVGD